MIGKLATWVVFSRGVYECSRHKMFWQSRMFTFGIPQSAVDAMKYVHFKD